MVPSARQGHSGPVPIRIALVDDHSQFRNYLADVLSRQPGLSVVLQAQDGVAAAKALNALAAGELPDVVLMDVDMPRGGGIAATREILRLHPGLCIVALSMHDDPRLFDAMHQAGARGHVLKGEPLAALLAIIRGSAI
jgi:two-component system invasion response regulator UvrY